MRYHIVIFRGLNSYFKIIITYSNKSSASTLNIVVNKLEASFYMKDYDHQHSKKHQNRVLRR